MTVATATPARPMPAVIRMALLDLRTVTPYGAQGIGLFIAVGALFFNRPPVMLPAMILFFAATAATYPFNVADKAGLDTLYAVLPIPRRAVVLGHYVWALACFAATTVVGLTAAIVLARIQSITFDARTVTTVLTASWALFAISAAIQLPLLLRFGHTRISALSTIVPLAVIMLGLFRTHPTLTSVRPWLPLIALAAAAAFATSAFLAPALTRRQTP